MSSLTKFESGSDQDCKTFVKEHGHIKYTWTLDNAKEVMECCDEELFSPEFSVKTSKYGTVTFHLVLNQLREGCAKGIFTFWRVSLAQNSPKDVAVRCVLEGAQIEPIMSFYQYRVPKTLARIDVKDNVRLVMDLTVIEIVEEK